MEDVQLVLDRDYTIGSIDPHLFGSFVEHLGRCVYQGIYQPGNKSADENGFRKDVLALVRELGVSIVRYPGGNYVSGYRWEDSVGPKRTARLDLAWRSLEPNTFGLHEFAAWSKEAGSEMLMTVNLGTRGIVEAQQLVEYANLEKGSEMAELRRSHGYKEPLGITYWCLGNEMDGPWQIAHHTAEEYGRLALETGKVMRLVDPSVKLVSCGSSGPDMETFPEWERTTLTEDYDVVDYISLHSYYGNEDGDTPEYLAKSLVMDRFIRNVVSACDYVKSIKRGKKDIDLSFDEWNVWFHSKEQDEKTMAEDPWKVAPHLLEDVYTMEDALMVGSMLITLLRHADRVKIACLAQLVNVIAPIMTSDDSVWRQTIYYPFLDASMYGRGTALLPIVKSPTYGCRSFSAVPSVEAMAVLNDDDHVTVFAVNKDLQNRLALTVDLRSFGKASFEMHRVLRNDDLLAVNTEHSEKVKPVCVDDCRMEGGKYLLTLPPASWNVIRFALAPV